MQEHLKIRIHEACVPCRQFNHLSQRAALLILMGACDSTVCETSLEINASRKRRGNQKVQVSPQGNSIPEEIQK